MNKSVLTTIVVVLFLSAAGYAQNMNKLVSSKTHIKFFSTTPAEDIEATNTASVSTINRSTGETVFSVPMQSFEFEKALMQKHFNSDKFLDTQTHPKAKLYARITNINQVNFSEDGTYPAVVEGELTLKGTTKTIKENGVITVKGNAFDVQSKFYITLADYGITFIEGKPTTNIAKTVEVTLYGQYKPE